jgi:predicted ester cyclase
MLQIDLNQLQAESRLKLVEEHLSAENAHDVGAIMKTFGKRPFFVLNGIALDGQESIRALYESFGFGERGAFSNISADIKHSHISSDAIIVELVLRGRHSGDWQGIAATYRKFEIPACAIFTFDEEGKLAGERVYFDAALLLQQIMGRADGAQTVIAQE